MSYLVFLYGLQRLAVATTADKLHTTFEILLHEKSNFIWFILLTTRYLFLALNMLKEIKKIHVTSKIEIYENMSTSVETNPQILSPHFGNWSYLALFVWRVWTPNLTPSTPYIPKNSKKKSLKALNINFEIRRVHTFFQLNLFPTTFHAFFQLNLNNWKISNFEKVKKQTKKKKQKPKKIQI